ncbi:hypothetical protein [Pseudoalteromonas rhizosphaerae]|uniref:hypothetical protein n=1 Tax=Pseudoalteromonas rhizosphaerae TaxID=2518973 RepID=UPI00384AF249
MSILSLNTYNHLFEKCQCELEELKSCSEHPKYDHLIFNIVFSINHLFEWYLKDSNISDDLKLQCINKFNPFDNYQNVAPGVKGFYQTEGIFPTTNIPQKTIRKLCNNAKHFNATPIEKQDKNYTCLAGSGAMEAGEPLAQAGQFDHYTYSVEINGIEEDLVGLLSRQIDEWNAFLCQGG